MRTNNLDTTTHPLITAQHVMRKAIVYIRHSSADAHSTARQRDQIQLAQQYGWRSHLIEVIDEDSGKSGASTEHRTGWQRLLDQINAGNVGAVFAANVSRLSRQVREFEKLRMLASSHGALLCVDNRIIDPSRNKD